MSLEFTRKQELKLKKIERLIYVRNVDGSFNKEGPIKHMVEVNIYYQEHREKRDRYDRRTEVECNFGNAVACLTQSGDRLKNRRSKDDKISKRM